MFLLVRFIIHGILGVALMVAIRNNTFVNTMEVALIALLLSFSAISLFLDYRQEKGMTGKFQTALFTHTGVNAFVIFPYFLF